MLDLETVAGFIEEVTALAQKRMVIYDQQILSALTAKALSTQLIDRRLRTSLAIDLAGTLSLARSQEHMNASEAFNWVTRVLGLDGLEFGRDRVEVRVRHMVETVTGQLARNVYDSVQHYDNVLMRVRTMSTHSNIPISTLAGLAFQKEKARVRFGNIDTLGRKGSDVRFVGLAYRSQLAGFFNDMVRHQMVDAGETEAWIYAPGHEYHDSTINLLPDGDIQDIEDLSRTVFHPGAVALIARKLTHK